ncbi:MAG: signal peptide peptidase SppA [Gemmataceae bacterium]
MLRRLILALCAGTLLPFMAYPPARAADKDEKSTKKEEKKSEAALAKVPVFRLTGSITEAPSDESFSFSMTPGLTLRELVGRMNKAAKDSSVKAVVLLSAGESLGLPQMEEVRQAMGKIREAGKDILVHADSLSMSEYVLFSGASRISVVPTGDLWITGIHGESPYIRGLLDKIGVKPDFLTCGEFKSAAEMFTREGPSPEAEKMQNWLLDGRFETEINLIAKGRKVDAKKVREWIDNGPYTAERAKEAGLIDAIEHRGTFEEAVKSKYGKNVEFDKKYGAKKQPKLDLSSPFAVFKMWGDMLQDATKKKPGKNSIAIVYVDGPISLGGGNASPFSGAVGARSTDIRKALDEAANDDNIKAVVLRVDSPGGSAVASEIILDATKRVKAKKPFIVSMGNVAGSGGYYVACGTDTIFADEATITGSIGVVSGKMVTNPMWSKVGITFKEYKRGANSDMLSSSSPFSKEGREKMQGYMDEIYKVFKGHVTEARGDRLKKPIDEIAGGRVYTGKQALELGLVDKIGTLEDAIKHIAGVAKLNTYEVRVVPESKNFIEKILEEALGESEDEPNRLEMAASAMVKGRQTSLIELAMPYLKGLDPQRVRSISQALDRLQLIQKEGVILMMPEMTFGH